MLSAFLFVACSSSAPVDNIVEPVESDQMLENNIVADDDQEEWHCQPGDTRDFFGEKIIYQDFSAQIKGGCLCDAACSIYDNLLTENQGDREMHLSDVLESNFKAAEDRFYQLKDVSNGKVTLNVFEDNPDRGEWVYGCGQFLYEQLGNEIFEVEKYCGFSFLEETSFDF